MSVKPDSCRGCPLYTLGEGWIPADGSGRNGILIVGEAGGAEEAKIGRPFVGASGQLLDRILVRAGLERDDFRIHNALSCRPPENFLVGAEYEGAALAHCAPNLDETIARLKPKVIVAMGNTPLKRLTGFSQITRCRGYVLPGPNGSWVVPTLHPSHLLPRQGQPSQAKWTGAVIHDLKKAVRIAREGFRRTERTFLCDPTPDVFWAYVQEFLGALQRDPGLYLSFDIETPYKIDLDEEELLHGGQEGSDGEDLDQEGERHHRPSDDRILRIGFCYEARRAVSVPFSPPYRDGIERLLRSGAKFVVWNGLHFDIPVLRASGIHLLGDPYDFMWAWHVLQSDLRRGLESVGSFFYDGLPWKHEAHSQPAWYNAVDAVVAWENAQGIERELKKAGQWNLFLQQVKDLHPVVAAAGGNGVRIDLGSQDELRRDLQDESVELTGRAQAQVPPDILLRKRWRKACKGSANAGAVAITVPGKVKRCKLCGATGVTKTAHCKGDCRRAEIETVDGSVTQWEASLPFNPGSRQHLANYIRFFNHPMGRDPKTGKPTVGKKHLAELERRFGQNHPIYATCRRYKAVDKVLGTYVNGFAPDKSGRVYTTYTDAPSTGRLSSRAVNLQNVSHSGEVLYADRIRRTILPMEGRVFVEADSSAIEAVFTGWFMGSEQYIALARKGIHDFLVCKELGIPFDEAGIAISRAEGNKGIRDRKKRTVHGVSYGMTAGMLAKQYPQHFATRGKAQKELDILFGAIPGLAEWQHRVRTEAHKMTYLQNPWGWRHYYYDVFKRGKDGKTALGEDGKRAVAFLPQSSAGMFMRDNAKLIAGKVPDRSYLPANFLVHDSYCLQVRKDEVEWASAVLEEVLTRPIPQMKGLRVGCEIKWGENWADLKKVRVVRV